MFSAFKRLAGKVDNAAQSGPPSHQAMPGTLQKKFSRGVQYNMKIIIKGDRNVGKSCLLERLQGKGFIEEYVPTDQIQVASIQWAFKATDDIVKVEVWDVVDRGKSRPQVSGLKLSLATSPIDSCPPALDAEFLDVYKGTHGVILMLDVTKNWTFEYVCKELAKVPEDLPVLILGNHCDMSHHRAVTNGQVTGFIENFDRPGETLYAESSMRNGFGLHLLHRFLGLPFLRLQKLSLELLLERNLKDTEITKEEIELFQQSDESNYNQFLENLVKKRRQIADHNAKVACTSNTSSMQENVNDHKDNKDKTQSTIKIGAGHPIIIAGKPNIASADPVKFSQVPNIVNSPIPAQDNKPSSSNENPIQYLDKNPMQNIENKRNNIIKTVTKSTISPSSKPLVSDNQIDSVEDFCPDDCLDKSFLDDLTINTMDIKHESDSDTETGNPLVATFQDEVEDFDISDNTEKESKKTNSSKTDFVNRNKSKETKLTSDLTYSADLNIINTSHFKSQRKEHYEKEEHFESDSLKSEELEGDFGSDDWIPDSKVRRSPEGGEDSTGTCSINQGLIEAKEKESKKHKKSKKSKDKSEKEKKKHSKRSDKKKRDELELFLNGPGNIAHEAEAYEAI